ncbi:hypothetical protein [Kitasatospora sp. MAP5-34]|uniref:hypothetical protein n=1 Tax=Kitasatospora sp. MAP5-34 TaxID=3035102 RepID=UPI00247623C4|nr:hypothetical protein [Kitasatospora sp. MAP5-34]MDH6578615.1 hypothetical protein [Kitasatospora sp. MAP5-34]
MSELESERGRLISRHRTMAEEAADALMAALRLAGLPPLVSLSPVYATGHEYGGHVALGGANARTVMAIAQYIAEHAECHGRIVSGELQPAQRELSA